MLSYYLPRLQTKAQSFAKSVFMTPQQKNKTVENKQNYMQNILKTNNQVILLQRGSSDLSAKIRFSNNETVSATSYMSLVIYSKFRPLLWTA